MKKEKIKVKVQLIGTIQEPSLKNPHNYIVEDINNETPLKYILKNLAIKYEFFRENVFNDENMKMKYPFSIIINDVLSASLNGMDTKIKDNDKIIISPPIAGG